MFGRVKYTDNSWCLVYLFVFLCAQIKHKLRGEFLSWNLRLAKSSGLETGMMLLPQMTQSYFCSSTSQRKPQKKVQLEQNLKCIRTHYFVYRRTYASFLKFASSSSINKRTFFPQSGREILYPSYSFLSTWRISRNSNRAKNAHQYIVHIYVNIGLTSFRLHPHSDFLPRF